MGCDKNRVITNNNGSIMAQEAQGECCFFNKEDTPQGVRGL